MIVFALLVATSIALCSSQAITVTGPLVDLYCWDTRNGIALDTGVQLRDNPYAHTVHCLVEVSICKNSGFAIVYKPDNATQYQVQYYLDEAGNAAAIEEMLDVPQADRNQRTGFNFTITGTPNDEDPPTLITYSDTGSSCHRIVAGMWIYIAAVLMIVAFF